MCICPNQNCLTKPGKFWEVLIGTSVSKIPMETNFSYITYSSSLFFPIKLNGIFLSVLVMKLNVTLVLINPSTLSLQMCTLSQWFWNLLPPSMSCRTPETGRYRDRLNNRDWQPRLGMAEY